MLTYENWQEPTVQFEQDETYKAALNVLTMGLQRVRR